MESKFKGQFTINPSAYLQHKQQRQSTGQNVDISTEFTTLIDRLTHGTAAEIDIVHHPRSRLVAAVKVFKTTKGDQADRELSILTSMSTSPFLLHCYDAFVTKGCRCLLLQYAPFGNLDTLTRALKGLGSDKTRMYAKELAHALVFLHSHHIIHRDVKPENILILWTGHVVLADFNISFRMTPEAPMSSQPCGTYLTRPPEVWLGQTYNQTLDVWMYGISLFNIASNTWPFLRVNVQKHVEALQSGQVSFNDQFFSPQLSDLIRQTLQVEASRRIPTDRILQHEYFQGVDQSYDVPFSPMDLLSLVIKSPTEKDIVAEILRDSYKNHPTQTS